MIYPLQFQLNKFFPHKLKTESSRERPLPVGKTRNQP